MKFTYQGVAHALQLPDPLPSHYAYTFASAIAAAAGLGIAPEKSLAALAGFRTPAGRFRLFRGLSDSTIVDSSYNSSPRSLRESLEHFSRLARRYYRIAVVGDMRELGLQSKYAHKELADQVAAAANEVILFGKETAEYTLPVLSKRGIPVHHFSQMPELVKYLRARLQPNVWVLVKGSQNTILLERAVEAILKDPSDVKFLCRRGRYWDRILAKTP